MELRGNYVQGKVLIYCNFNQLKNVMFVYIILGTYTHAHLIKSIRASPSVLTLLVNLGILNCPIDLKLCNMIPTDLEIAFMDGVCSFTNIFF